MKKLFKFLGYFILSVLLLCVILFIVASLSQKKIVDIALKKINESTNIPIETEDLSFTLIKRFPYATIELNGVKIGALDSITTNSGRKSNEDILNIESVFVSVKTKPLFRGEFEIIKVEIKDASLNYKVDSLGHSNIDFLLKSNKKDTLVINSSGTIPDFDLKRVKLNNVAIFYVDDKIQASANLFFPSLDIAGKFVNENFTGTVKGDLLLTKCSYPSTNLNRLEEAVFDFDLDYNSDTLQINKLETNTEGVQFSITGKAAFTKNIFTDLTFETEKLELGKLHQYAPDELLNKYGIEDLNGIMNLSGTAKGIVSDSVMPAVEIVFELKNGTIKTKEYPAIKKLDFAGTISNGSERNNKTTSLFFKSFQAETDSSSVDLSLSLSNFDKPKYTLNSKLKIDIDEFKNFIPDTLIQNISGKLTGEFSTNGELPDSIDDNFINYVFNNSSANIDFSKFNIELDSLSVKDFSGSIIYQPGQLQMNNVNGQIPAYQLNIKNTSFNAEITGLVMQAENPGINFESFYAEAAQGKVWGSAKIQNPKHPEFVIDANASVNLSELKPFIPDTLVKNLTGNLAAEIISQGKLNLDSVAGQINEIIFKQSKLTFDAKNISVTMPDTLQNFKVLNGVVKMENDSISISKMSGVAAGIDFLIDSATIANVYNTLILNKNETLSAYGILKFGAIDYSLLAPLIPAETSENAKTNDSEPRNFLFEVKGKIAAKSVKYEKILAENISAKFNVSDSVYIIDQLKVKAFDGTSNSSLRFSIIGNGKQTINVKNQVNRMDINKFMYAFDNFGCDSLISYKNIEGLVSADLNSRIVFNADTLVTEDMRVKGDLTLENGRIINYQPAMDVASFTGIKELDNIELKTLKSNLFIFKNQMFIPATDVVSSSMDFSVFGMQSFGENYEYHLQMHLGDVLKGKSKKLIERQNASGDELSSDDMDRSTIKIIYANIDGKAKAGFDNKKAIKCGNIFSFKK